MNNLNTKYAYFRKRLGPSTLVRNAPGLVHFRVARASRTKRGGWCHNPLLVISITAIIIAVLQQITSSKVAATKLRRLL